MWLVGERAFADAIKLGLLTWDHPGFRVDPKSNDWCPSKRKGLKVSKENRKKMGKS